ncbi:MAG: hypothetical protein Q4Q03_07825 [Bowdeniella nasicola]|nr:hypothetical protein [Bowdeniella nasicola]
MADTSPHRSLVGRYRDLFSLTGAIFVVVGFVARLPLAMAQLGILLMVTAATDSYTAGGTCAGALAVANAIGAPIAGAITDRRGQRRVVLVQSLLSGIFLIAVVVATRAGWSWPLLAMVAAVAGLFLPQVGTLARIRWRAIVKREGEIDRERLQVAFSWEGAGDEASFVLGPATVGLITAILNAQVAVIAAAIVILIFGTSFALHPTAAYVPGSHSAVDVATRAITTVAWLMIISQFLVGTMFGSIQTGTTVLARAAGSAGMAGLLHALLGLGSATAGIAIAALPTRFTHAWRIQVFSLTLFVLALPLLWVHSLGGLALVLSVMGFAIAPLMITNFSIVELVTIPTRLGAVMTVLAATTGLGYAAGSSSAGRLADWGRTAMIGGEPIGGYLPAFAVTIIGAFAALITAQIAARRLRNHAGG